MKRSTFFLTVLLFFSISIMAQNEELPAISARNRADFFIPSGVCNKYQLEIGQNDEWMKVYNNSAEGSAFQRVNDIRWQATSREAARAWYGNNKQLLSEDGDDITRDILMPAGLDSWNVYTAGAKAKKLFKAMGVEQGHYYFVFSVGQYVGKIFIATNTSQNVFHAWQLAKEGVRATLIAAGKKDYADMLR